MSTITTTSSGNDRRTEARHLRQVGHSVRQIARMVGAAKSTVSGWVSDVILTEEQKQALAKRQKEAARKGQDKRRVSYSQYWRRRRLAWQEEGRRLARSGHPDHLAGCMLYWGEGTKCSPRSVEFTNTDADMLRFFLHRFLRPFFQVASEEIRVRVAFHDDHGLSATAVEDYWLDVLSLPRTCLGKTTVKAPKSASALRHRLKPYGTCRIVVNRTDVFQSIVGSIQEYGKMERPEWLF